jgi:hypothetical protein
VLFSLLVFYQFRKTARGIDYSRTTATQDEQQKQKQQQQQEPLSLRLFHQHLQR